VPGAAPSPASQLGSGASGAPGPDGSGQPLAEAAARAVLAELFRGAGYRIRHDVPLPVESGTAAPAGTPVLAVDGFDPESGVGFEYVAAEERDGSPVLRGQLAGRRARILWLEAADEPTLRRQAEQFLSGLR
jgi:hypothetical protein